MAILTNRNKITNYANRGQYFENLIDFTNNVYARKEIALINKRPTPIKVIRSNYGRITHAVYAEKSTVDYDGIYKGKAVVFEAKSTKGKSLPLSNITDEQMEYLEKAKRHGAVSFIIINMIELDKTYILHNGIVQSYRKNAKEGGRKSIPLQAMKDKGKEVKSENGVPLDYITALESMGYI